MKTIYLSILLLASTVSLGQILSTDSLKQQLAQSHSDTNRVLLLVRLGGSYIFIQPDSAIIVAHQAIQEAQSLHFVKGEGRALNVLGAAQRLQGDLPQSFENHLQALQFSRTSGDQEEEARSLSHIGHHYAQLSEYRQALSYLNQAMKMAVHLQPTITLCLSSIGDIYERMNQLDSALLFQQQAYATVKDLPRGTLQSLILTRLGIIQVRLGNNTGALNYYQDALTNAYITGDLLNWGRIQFRIAEIYREIHQPDSSLYYARLAFDNSQKTSMLTQLNASNLLVKLYKDSDNLDSAFHYQQVAMSVNDRLYGPEKFQQLQLLTLAEQQRQQQMLQEQARSKDRFQRIGLLSALGVFLLIALLLWRNNRQKQKDYALLQKQKQETDKQKIIVEQTLSELKSTQAQLIQSEKMASLGEVTAGIAHEIQNPLNFVNNFSEVNRELISEIMESIESDNKAEALSLASNIEQNLDKVVSHGKRAEAIVKSMLLHSNMSTGKKELTNINDLAQEYLNLSYHACLSGRQGIKAKDNSLPAGEAGFNATLQTDFDQTLGKINIKQGEIGLVLLNLYNNAFYAMNEKKNQQLAKYEPVISVSTKNINGKIEIKVRDNGNGIPSKIVDKIFQPFFTTKPTGQGSGLGLSLSYDIVKASGGELKVKTQEGDGAEFTILLPS